MSFLKVSLKSELHKPNSTKYENQINAENFKEVAIVLSDLSNYGVPIEKAIKEYKKEKKSNWDEMIGI